MRVGSGATKRTATSRPSSCASRARRGPKKAAVAVAASILTAAYHMLRDGTCYQDLGADYFARRNPRRSWPSSQAASAALAMTSSLRLQRLQHDVTSFWRVMMDRTA